MPHREPDAWSQGYNAWNEDVPLSANPFWPDSEDAQQWEDGWHEAAVENSQFGVGA